MSSLPRPPSRSGHSGWPAVAWEELTWTPSMAATEMSRAEAARQTGRYRAALPARIAKRRVPMDTDLAAEVGEVSAEIARFDVELGDELAPFTAMLLRSEAAASSEIEHLTASARAVATAELGEPSSHNATEIVANTRTMQAALRLADHLDEGSILAMHAALMESRPGIAGRWRTQQVWIGRGIGGPLLADFVPPRHEHVVPLMDDLLTFIVREDIPVLAQAAIAHAQFETVHPFADGNGRVGRALVHAILKAKGLVRRVTFPMSAGLLTDTNGYFDALRAYQAGEPDTIIRMVVAASFRALANGRELSSDLRSIRDRWNDKLSARQDSLVWTALDVIVQHPVVNHEALGRELGSANPDRYLRALAEVGILTEFSGRKRNRLWRSPEVLAALDAFAARAGRRR